MCHSKGSKVLILDHNIKDQESNPGRGRHLNIVYSIDILWLKNGLFPLGIEN